MMNDVLISAILQMDYYVGSIATYEARYGGANGRVNFRSTREYELARKLPELIRANAKQRPHGKLYYLEPKGVTEAGRFAIVGEFTTPQGMAKARRQSVNITDEAARAARAQSPPDYGTHYAHRQAVMVHFAGIRTGAHSRRAVLRAQGLWHLRADTIMSNASGFGKRARHLVWDEPSFVRNASTSGALLDLFYGNYLLIALFSDSIAVLPDFVSCNKRQARGFDFNQGGAMDRYPTIPRLGEEGACS